MKYGALDSLPRQTTIGGQPHMLAYINPEEEGMIQNYRGNMPPVAGPDGVPAYFFHSSWGGGGGSTSTSSNSSNNDKDDKPGFFESIGNVFSAIGTEVKNAFTGGGKDNVGNFGLLGDALGGIGDDLGITDYGTNDPKPTKTSTETTNVTAPADVQLRTEIKSLDNGTQYYVNSDGTYGGLVVAAVAPKFYDAFGNEYATRGEAINADEVGELSGTLSNTAVSGAMSGGDGGYYDAFGNEYGSSAGAAAADIMGSAESKAASGSQEVKDHIDKFGTSYLEDRFLTTQINPNTGTYYEPRDTNIVNPLDADTIPYAGSDNTYTDKEIQYFGGDPYSSTVGGVSLNDPFDDPRTEVIETEEDYPGSVTYVPPKVVVNPPYVPPEDGGGGGPATRQVRGTKDLYGDFYGGRSGGLWKRFQGSYLTRFNQPTQGIDEMVRVVEQEDGSKLYYGADGALLNPYCQSLELVEVAHRHLPPFLPCTATQCALLCGQSVLAASLQHQDYLPVTDL